MTHTTHSRDVSWPHTIASEYQPTVRDRTFSATPETITEPGKVLWRELAFYPKDDSKSDDFADIDEAVNRYESTPERVALLREARKQLAAKYYGESHSMAALRLRKGWSQQRLADEINAQQPYIARVETGSVDIQFSTAVRLARALGVSLDEIAGGIQASRERR
jgi:DNA-binding XRE family transcriptional regulator